jgi:hypothetical protein
LPLQYNITGDERLSQSSSQSANDGQAQPQQPVIKSILKKRDNVSNENLDGFGSGSINAGIGSVSSVGGSSQASQELRVADEEEKFRESEERLLSDLSPTRVFLEARFVGRNWRL